MAKAPPASRAASMRSVRAETSKKARLSAEGKAKDRVKDNGKDKDVGRSRAKDAVKSKVKGVFRAKVVVPDNRRAAGNLIRCRLRLGFLAWGSRAATRARDAAVKAKVVVRAVAVGRPDRAGCMARKACRAADLKVSCSTACRRGAASYCLTAINADKVIRMALKGTSTCCS